MAIHWEITKVRRGLQFSLPRAHNTPPRSAMPLFLLDPSGDGLRRPTHEACLGSVFILLFTGDLS